MTDSRNLSRYCRPELLAEPDRTVHVVEGEKDVERLRSLGLVATCNNKVDARTYCQVRMSQSTPAATPGAAMKYVVVVLIPCPPTVPFTTSQLPCASGYRLKLRPGGSGDPPVVTLGRGSPVEVQTCLSTTFWPRVRLIVGSHWIFGFDAVSPHGTLS